MKKFAMILTACALLGACSGLDSGTPKELVMEAVNDSTIWVKRDGKETEYKLQMAGSQWGSVPFLLENWLPYWEKYRTHTQELNLLQLQDVTGEEDDDTVVAEARIEDKTCLIRHRILGGGLLLWNDTLRLTEADMVRYYGNNPGFANALGPYAFLFWAYEHRNFTRSFAEDPQLLLKTNSPLFQTPADSLYWIKTLPDYHGHSVDAMDGRSLIWNEEAKEMQVYYR